MRRIGAISGAGEAEHDQQRRDVAQQEVLDHVHEQQFLAGPPERGQGRDAITTKPAVEAGLAPARHGAAVERERARAPARRAGRGSSAARAGSRPAARWRRRAAGASDHDPQPMRPNARVTGGMRGSLQADVHASRASTTGTRRHVRRAGAGRRRLGLVEHQADGQASRQAPGVEQGGHRGREVEARDALAHRQADAGVGAREQLGARGPGARRRTRGSRGPAAALGCSCAPSGSTAISGRSWPRLRGAPASPPRASSARCATGSAKCRPALPRSAAGSHGSCTPLLSTPATSAAAATRTQAPMLPRSRGRSSSTIGAGRASCSSASDVYGGRRASAITPVGGGCGASARNASGESVCVSGGIRASTSGASAPASACSRSGSVIATHTISAPKRRACLRACSPSSTASSGSRRASRKILRRAAGESCSWPWGEVFCGHPGYAAPGHLLRARSRLVPCLLRCRGCFRRERLRPCCSSSRCRCRRWCHRRIRSS